MPCPPSRELQTRSRGSRCSIPAHSISAIRHVISGLNQHHQIRETDSYKDGIAHGMGKPRMLQGSNYLGLGRGCSRPTIRKSMSLLAFVVQESAEEAWRPLSCMPLILI